MTASVEIIFDNSDHRFPVGWTAVLAPFSIDLVLSRFAILVLKNSEGYCQATLCYFHWKWLCVVSWNGFFSRECVMGSSKPSCVFVINSLFLPFLLYYLMGFSFISLSPHAQIESNEVRIKRTIGLKKDEFFLDNKHQRYDMGFFFLSLVSLL